MSLFITDLNQQELGTPSGLPLRSSLQRRYLLPARPAATAANEAPPPPSRRPSRPSRVQSEHRRARIQSAVDTEGEVRLKD
ncbi:hypothetical protein AOLI_G00019880 [Acnodon oligacanthus]